MTALLGLATRLGLARLMLITDTRAARGDLAEFADAALAGGVDVIQLRDPAADQATQLAALQVLRDVGHRYQSLVSSFESAELAEGFQSDLLHLSERGMPAAEARKHLHPWALIGRSCHSPQQVDAAIADPDVHYLTVGPVVEGLGLVGYAAEVAPPGDPASKPWFAVGGVSEVNLDGVLAAGARRVAVTRAITNAPDPEAAAVALKDRLRHAWQDDPAMQQLVLNVFRT